MKTARWMCARKARRLFRILQEITDVPDKLYAGAIVTYPANVTDFSDTMLSRRIVTEVQRLFALLNAPEKFPAGKTEMLSYEIAHYVGFSPEQEYELLGLFTELQRLEYIRRHLSAIIPLIKELEVMKERIQRNGHFRHLRLGRPVAIFDFRFLIVWKPWPARVSRQV